MASADIGISKNALKISTVIFDESGKYKDRDGVFVFAGFATFPVFLDVLVKEWLDCMLLAGLPHTSTSMKEAIVFRGPFESIRLDRDRRDCILRKLAHVIADNSDKLVHLASPLSRSTTEEFLKLPQQKRGILRNDPYYAAFEACIKGALDVREDTQLHIVCDLAEQYSEECVSVFQQLRRMDERVKRRCLGIAFSDDDYYPPLQMADMLAYCHRAYVLHKRGKPYEPIVEELVNILGIPYMEERTAVYRLSGSLGGIGEAVLE